MGLDNKIHDARLPAYSDKAKRGTCCGIWTLLEYTQAYYALSGAQMGR
jgi:hypothetical protein